jgi:hypothetical protein
VPVEKDGVHVAAHVVGQPVKRASGRVLGDEDQAAQLKVIQPLHEPVHIIGQPLC